MNFFSQPALEKRFGSLLTASTSSKRVTTHWPQGSHQCTGSSSRRRAYVVYGSAKNDSELSAPSMSPASVALSMQRVLGSDAPAANRLRREGASTSRAPSRRKPSNLGLLLHELQDLARREVDVLRGARDAQEQAGRELRVAVRDRLVGAPDGPADRDL